MEEGTHAQRFDAIFTSLRDVQRGVQVVRDKQVSLLLDLFALSPD